MPLIEDPCVNAVRTVFQKEDLFEFEYYLAEFAVIMARIQAILVNRKEDEILEIAKILDEVDTGLDLLDWIKEIQTEVEKVIDSENADLILKLPLSAAKSLAYCIENNYFNVSEQDYDAELEEYFAVLSMAHVGYSFLAHERMKEQPKNHKNEIIDLMQIGQYVRDATEAIAYAESLIMIKRAEKAAAKREQVKRSDNARKAGKASQVKTNILVKDLYMFFIEKGYENYTQATEEFLKTIPEERYRHLMPSNRNRTLRERLSRLVRGIDTL